MLERFSLRSDDDMSSSCCPKDLSRAATAAAVRPPEGTRKGSMGRRACVRYNT